MKRLAIAVYTTVLLAAASLPALAAVVTGSIESVDVAAHSVTLDDGNTYVLPEDFDVSALTVGLHITFTYDEVDGKRTVSAVSSPG